MSLDLVIDNEQDNPAVVQIQQQIRAMIRQRTLKTGQKIPSMRKLSQQVGVSVGIVKQAINILVAQGYLMSQPGSGVYVADSHVMRKCISMVLPTISERTSRIMMGVKKGLAVNSSQLQVQAADLDFAQEADIISRLDSSQVAGAIIYPPPINAYIPPLLELRRRGVPYVLVDSEFDSIGADSVTVNQFEMGKMAMEYLLAKGHTRIGIVDLSVDVGLQKVRMGAADVLRTAGIDFDALPRIITDAEDLNADQPCANGEQAAKELLQAHSDLTAIWGVNEFLSLGALRGAKAMGRSVPGDISILGFGDFSASQLSAPPLTIIEQPLELIGKRAAERLLDILNEEQDDPVSLRLKPRLIERESVASRK